MKNWNLKLHLKNVLINNYRTKLFLFIYVFLANTTIYCQTIKEKEDGCKCSQIYSYRNSTSILTNNTVVNEYFNDSILIVKYGRFDPTKKLSFENFIEFELRRDTFIIIDGNYFKVFNGDKYRVLSREDFFARSTTIKLNYMPTINRITKQTFSPKESFRVNDTTYFLYKTKTSRLIPSDEVKLNFLNLYNLKETYDYSNTDFVIDENSNELAYFIPGRGFLKIEQNSGYEPIWVFEFLQTEKCDEFISVTFLKWYL